MNPERYTGYKEPHAHKIWNAIYRENCFMEYDWSIDNSAKNLNRINLFLPSARSKPTYGPEPGTKIDMNLSNFCFVNFLGGLI